MDGNTKLTALISLLLASAFFLSITVFEQNQRKQIVLLNELNQRLKILSNDTWCKLMIADRFSGFPVAYLGNVTNTSELLKEGISPNMAEIVVWKSGKHPEFFRWFSVFQRENDSIQFDPTNHYHLGFITSDLEVYDIGLDPMLV